VGTAEGPEPFAEAARRAAASWKFAPAQRDGKPLFLTEAFIDQGTGFTLLTFGNGMMMDGLSDVGTISVGGGDGLVDTAGLAAKRYDAEDGTAYLLRPDGYVAARFRHPTRPALDAALSRAAGIN